MGEQTTLLWNLANQQPESVPLSQVGAAIKAGTHRAYEKTGVEQTTATPGLTTKVDPDEAQFRQSTVGADQALDEAAKRSQQAAVDARKGSYDSFSDALDAAADSYVDSMTLGIVDPTSGDTLRAENARMKQEAHPIASKIGTGAAIAVTLLPTGGASGAVGGSKIARILAKGAKAVEATPLGAAIKAQEAVTQGLRAKLAAGGAKGSLLAAAGTEALGGAAGGFVMGVGHQIGNAVNGRQVSGDAIVDDVGLGTILSGGLALAGGAFGRAAQRIKNGRQEVVSAARLDELMTDVHGAVQESSGTYASSHADSARRLKQLNDMAKKGHLDAELTGSEWLEARNKAQADVDKAHEALLKTTGAKDLESAVTRIGDLLKSGSAKDIERVAVAYGNYGKAVTKFEEAMRPTQFDYEHLLNINALDDLDAASFDDLGEHLQEYEKLVAKGASDQELNNFMRERGIRGEAVPNTQKTGRVSPKARKAAPVEAPVEAPATAKAPRYKAEAKTQLREFDVGDLDTPGIPHSRPKTEYREPGEFDVGDLDSPATPAPVGRQGLEGKHFDLSDVGTEAAGDDLMFQLQASKRAQRPVGAGEVGPMRRTAKIARDEGVETTINVKGRGEGGPGNYRITEPLLKDVNTGVRGIDAGAVADIQAQLDVAVANVNHLEKEAGAFGKDVQGNISKQKADALAAAKKEAAELSAKLERARTERHASASLPDQPIGEQFGPGRADLGRMGARGRKAMEAHRVLNESKFAVLPTDAAIKINDIGKKLVEATGGRLGTQEARELARLLKVNTVRVSDAGPIAEKIMDAWSLKKLAEQLGSVAGKKGKAAANSLVGKAARAGVVAQTRRMLPGGFVGGAAGYAMGGAVGAILGASGTLSAIAGRMKNGAVMGLAKALNPVGRKFISFSVMGPAQMSYDGSEPTKNFAVKADQLRKLAASESAMRKTIGDSLADMKHVDPIAYNDAVEASVRRVRNLAAKLPAGTYRGPFQPPGPPDQIELDNFHTYEAITANRDAVFEYIKAGSMPEAVVEAMREQHPDYLNEILEYVTQHPDEVMKAPVASQIALSRLLGINLTQEADPLYIQRQQQGYIKMKEEAEQRKMTQQGASIMRGGMPAPLPQTPAQQFATLPNIR